MNVVKLPKVNLVEQIQDRLQPLQTRLKNHAIYGEIDRLESLHCFMQNHVFAVWDFMSLLKSLQQHLCCLETPWLPPRDGEGSRFINEIVLAEESDRDGKGGFASHFELYLSAMKQTGAETGGIDNFLNLVKDGVGISEALRCPHVPDPARRFVQMTFSVIESGDLCSMVSAFTFGREVLLPEIFGKIVKHLNQETGGQLSDFLYYLGRHIELDSGEHGPMASRLLKSACGNDIGCWKRAEAIAFDCLLAREQLWDGILASIRAEK